MPELNDLPGILIAIVLGCGLCYLLYKDHASKY